MARIYISCSDRDAEASARIKDWLKSQGYEHIAIDELAHSESEKWAGWQKDLSQTLDQCDAAILILTPNWHSSKWCFAEFTEAFSTGKTIFALIETSNDEKFSEPGIPIFDLTKDREKGLASFSVALRDLTFFERDNFVRDPSRTVFPGLNAFEEQDAAVFFGYDDDLRRVIDRLNSHKRQGNSRLVALLGTPGKGISSFLMAGVLPRLKKDHANWIVLPCIQPGLFPVDEFARSISTALEQPDHWSHWSNLLKGNEFKQVVKQLAEQLYNSINQKEARILVSIDQAEELFSISDPQEAARFLDILEIMFKDEIPCFAIAALRPEFLTAVQTSEQLSDLVDQMSPDLMPLPSIRQIINGPLEIADIAADEALIEALIHDATKEGALALLGYTLRVLSDRGGNRLSLEDYTALADPNGIISPLGNSISKMAEDVLVAHRLSKQQLDTLHRLFTVYMLWKGREGQYVARPIGWQDIPSSLHALIHNFIDIGILNTRVQRDGETVEFAHLSILKHWSRLTIWLATPVGYGEEEEDTDFVHPILQDMDIYPSSGAILETDDMVDEPFINPRYTQSADARPDVDVSEEVEITPISSILSDDGSPFATKKSYSRDAEDIIPEEELTRDDIKARVRKSTSNQPELDVHHITTGESHYSESNTNADHITDTDHIFHKIFTRESDPILNQKGIFHKRNKGGRISTVLGFSFLCGLVVAFLVGFWSLRHISSPQQSASLSTEHQPATIQDDQPSDSVTRSLSSGEGGTKQVDTDSSSFSSAKALLQAAEKEVEKNDKYNATAQVKKKIAGTEQSVPQNELNTKLDTTNKSKLSRSTSNDGSGVSDDISGDKIDNGRSADLKHVVPNTLRNTPSTCGDPTVNLTSMRGGMTRIQIASSCRAGQSIELNYAGVRFARKLNENGHLEIIFDCFAGDRQPIEFLFSDGHSITRSPVTKDLDRVSKVAVIWQQPINIDLHAYEYAAAPGEDGHLWENHRSAFADANKQAVNSNKGRGYLSSVSNAKGNGQKIEVYTFINSPRQTRGIIKLALNSGGEHTLPQNAACEQAEPLSVEYNTTLLVRNSLIKKSHGVLLIEDCDKAQKNSNRPRSDAVSDLVVGK